MMGTALIVEDHPEQADLVARILRLRDYEAIIAEDGETGLRLARQHVPDVLLLDLMLPDINGQAVCELIRRDPTMSDIKIICISGVIEVDKIQELTDSGADDFLHKPLDIDELMRRVCRLLDMEASVVS